jgi:chromosome partitioning protein
MQIIVVASRKGGVGKTTLTAHLAVAANQSHAGKVAVLDFDPQGSLSWWAQHRQKTDPRFDSITEDQLTSHLAQLRKQGHEFVLIDTPPVQSPWINKLIARADLVVIPTRASPLDIQAIGSTMLAARNADTDMVWVLNGISSRSHIADAVAEELKKFAPLAPVHVHERTDYVMAMGQGKTVLETRPSGVSAKEIRAVWQFITARLAKKGAPA